MKKILISILALVVGGCGFAYAMSDYSKSWAWTYKITIEIETPEGIKSGSAVRKVEAKLNAAELVNPIGKDVHYRTYGEAVLIDLGRNGLLFHPIGWDYNQIEKIFPYPDKTYDPVERLNHFSDLKTGTNKTSSSWRSFIHLDTNNASSSLKRLDSKDFDKQFGGNVTFKSVTYEITDEPISWKIDEVVNELVGRYGNYRKKVIISKK